MNVLESFNTFKAGNWARPIIVAVLLGFIYRVFYLIIMDVFVVKIKYMYI